jgi:hypothetical protein
MKCDRYFEEKKETLKEKVVGFSLLISLVFSMVFLFIYTSTSDQEKNREKFLSESNYLTKIDIDHFDGKKTDYYNGEDI